MLRCGEVSIRHQPEYLPSRIRPTNGRERTSPGSVSIRHQPEYLPSHHQFRNQGQLGNRNSGVSIRHQPEYLPSLGSHYPHNQESLGTFQSGISLSICLHTDGEPDQLRACRPAFQSGISLSICLHAGDNKGTVVGPCSEVFQSGISLSICLHRQGQRVRFQSGISLSICLHTSHVCVPGVIR